MRLAAGGAHRAVDGVVHLVPIAALPLGLPGAPLASVSRRACGRSIAKVINSRGMAPVDIAIVDQPLFVGLLEHIEASRVVYRPTDTHDDGALAVAQRKILPKVDGLVATSEVILERLTPRIDGVPTLVLENGVEFERFEGKESAARPAAVYIGALDHRFDWQAVVAMARAAPWAPFVLAGPLVDSRPPPLPGNIRLLGPLPYERVPELLQSATVGLLPLTGVPMNNGRSPMKYYEYLAAGLRVLATDTPTLHALRAPGVELYRSHAEASRQISDQLSIASRNEEGVEFARHHDWSSRARRLSAFLNELPSRPAAPVAR